MGWQDDLQSLIDDVGESGPGALVAWAESPLTGLSETGLAQTGVGQGVRSVFSSSPLDTLGRVLNLPSDVTKPAIGMGMNLLQGEGITDPYAGREQWESAIQGLREGYVDPWGQGWQPLTGELGKLKTPIEIAANLAIDPLSYTGFGAGSKAIRALKEMGMAASNPIVGAGLRGAALPIEAAQYLNDLPGKALAPIQAGVRALKKPIEKVSPDAFKLAPDEADAFLREKIGMADQELATTPHGIFQPGTGRVSAESEAVLTAPMKSGKTVHTTLTEFELAATDDINKLNAAGVTWDEWATGPERLKAAEASGNADAIAIVKRYNKDHLDPLHPGNPHQVAIEQTLRQVAKDEGRQYAHSTVPALLRSAWTELTLLSPRLAGSNMVGNFLQLAMSGTNPVFGWREQEKIFKLASNGINHVTAAQTKASLAGNEAFRKLGLDGLPDFLFRGGNEVMTMNPDRYTRSAVGELTGRFTKSPALAKKAAALVNLNNDTVRAIDWMARVTKGVDFAPQRAREVLAPWEAAIEAKLPPGTRFSIIDEVNAPAEKLRTKDGIAAHLQGLGMSVGNAEQAGRQFVNLRKTILNDTREAVNKTIFAGDRTNIEQNIGKFVPFMYWYSRAQRFYWENALRHPMLLGNYLRMQDGLEAAQNAPGMDARQKGFLHVLNTGLGFSLLMNPDALFGVTKILGFQEDYEPDGTTKLGSMLNFMQDQGIGMFPWWREMFNLAGVYGNTFEPDLLPIRQKALVGSVINAVNAHMGGAPIGAPLQNAGGQLRGVTSGIVGQILPDVLEPWLAQPVRPKGGGSQQEATLDNLIENVIMENNADMPLTGQQLLDIMTDEKNPEYIRAYQQVADTGMAAQLLNFVVPTQFKMRHNQRDADLAGVNAVNEEADKQGLPAFKVAPTLHDLDFAARYKQLTGREWSPTDYKSAALRQDLARTPNAQKPLLMQESAYLDLGTQRQRNLNSRYQAIRNGEDPLTAGILDEPTREQIAGEWLTRRRGVSGVEDVQNQRNAFEAAYPEFGQFKSWQSSMYHLKTQLGGSLEQYRRRAIEQNPNAAAYFASKGEWIKRTFPEAEWESAFDDATLNMAAFQAINGMAERRTTQGPVPGAPLGDPTIAGYQSSMMPQPVPDWLQVVRGMSGGSPLG